MTNRTSPVRPAARAVAVLALAVAALAPHGAQAAITQPTAWTSEYAAVALPTGNVGTLSIAAGTNRMLVVAIVSSAQSANLETVTSVTYGGRALTLAQGDASAISQTHTYLYYLNDAGITAATSTTLSVNMSGPTPAYTWVYAAVFAGVNQTTPFTSTQNSNSLATASGADVWSTALTMSANDQPLEVVLLQRSASGTNVRTVTTWAANWGGATGGTLPVSVSNNDAAWMPQMYIAHRAVPGSSASETGSDTLSSASSLWSKTGVSLQAAAAAGTITLGNNTGTDATNATICAAPAVSTYIDFFTLLASASGTNVTGITTTFSPTIPAGLLSLLEVTSDTGTSQGSLANPSGTSPAVSGMSFAAPTTTTQYRLRITPNAAATSSGTFTATVTGVTNSAGFSVSGTDSSSATIIVDGQASPDVTAVTTSSASGSVTASWTNPAAGTVPATDFGNYVVVLGNTVAVTGVPAKGTSTYTVGSTIGADTVLCSGSITTCQKTGLGSSQTYYLKVFTRDGCANWSAGVQTSATTPAGPSTTIADGTNPSNVTQLAPGGAETPLDAFTLAASSGTDTVTGVTVTLAVGTGAAIQQLRVMSAATCTGTQYFTAVASPASDVVTLSGGTSIPVTTTATPYYVCITPKGYASLAPPPGQVYAVTGTVTSFTSTNPHLGADTASATVNIDDASSPDVSGASAVGGSGTVTASWTNPGAGTAPATDFGSYVVVLGNTVAVTNTPVDGTASYTTGTLIGADTVVCQGNIATCPQTGVSAGQAYYFKIFTRDLVNNWSAGVAVSASAQDTRTTPVALSGSAASCTTVNLSASYTGDSNANNTVTFTRGTDGVTFGTTVCSAVGGGTNPRACTDSTVSASTTYYYRATFADADGIVGTATKDSGAVAVGACAATLSVVAGTLPAAGNVAAGSSGTIVGRYALTPSGTLALSTLSASNTGTAVAGADVASLGLFDVTSATTVFVGAAAWNSTTSHWDFSSLGYNITAPVTLAVALNVGKGATPGRTFILNTNVPADVAVVSPATVSNSTTIAGNAFTITSGTPGGNKASNAPMVLIQNPANGKVVSGTFKVQVRLFNKERNNGAAGVTVTLSTDNGTTYPTTPVANAKYDAIDPTFAPTVTGRTFEAQLSLPIGSYTLRAKAVNAVPATTISEPIQITVAAAGKGDGNLLVRDNSSQLCNDCHAVRTHSSEAVGTKYGAWGVNCRDCHSPHKTRNIHLVNETIIPPSVVGTVLPAAQVGYVTQTGAIAGNGLNGTAPSTTASFVNQGDNSGPCQVCHTRTQSPGTGAARWQRQGNADTHYTSASTSPCAGCHSHTAGFAPSSCLGCHGVTSGEQLDLGASFWNNGIKATIDQNEWAYSGHGKTTGTYDITNNPAANLPTSPSPGTSECVYCHDDSVNHGTVTNPFRLRGAASTAGVTGAYTSASPNAPCLNCHGSTTNYGVTPSGQANKKGTQFVDTAHAGTKHTLTTLGGTFCWDCHDPHGDRLNSTTGNVAMIRKAVQTLSDGTYGYLGASGASQPVTFTTDVAGGPATGRTVETTTASGSQHVGLCQACHAATSDTLQAGTAWTKYWNRLGYDDPDGPGGTAPAASSHNATSSTTPFCISCHAHNKNFAGSGSCTLCHASAQTITQGPAAGGTRRAIVPEFSNTWSHKRSAAPSGTVSQWDCIVCHMEGDPTTGNPSALHANGYVDLRDPDTGTQIKQVTFSTAQGIGTGAGTYNSDPVNVASFAQWSRNLSSNVIEPAVAATMVNQCLKCHDSNGALAYGTGLPLNPLVAVNGGSAGKPFGTTITGSTGYDGANGLTACASGTNGCVVNVDASFVATNATYHPIKARQNNWYAKDPSRIQAPWTGATRSGSADTNSWGYLITCWDCHGSNAASGVQTMTVTAHGAPQTLRQAVWVSSTVNNAAAGSGNLCIVCHQIPASGSQNHATGSAWSSGGSSTPGSAARQTCYYCHSSSQTKPIRPLPGQDAHGFDTFTFLMGTDKLWPVGATETYKPYAFFRSVGSGTGWQGTWTGSSGWKPLSGPGVPTGTATCGNVGGGSCNQAGSYSPGGVY
jgi:hypothetical protein